MPPADQLEPLARRILPVMQEFGLSAFVLVGYLEDGQGKLQRVVIANTQRNPAFEDGLRPVMHFAQIWGASSASFAPNPDSPPKGEE